MKERKRLGFPILDQQWGHQCSHECSTCLQIINEVIKNKNKTVLSTPIQVKTYGLVCVTSSHTWVCKWFVVRMFLYNTFLSFRILIILIFSFTNGPKLFSNSLPRDCVVTKLWFQEARIGNSITSPQMIPLIYKYFFPCALNFK